METTTPSVRQARSRITRQQQQQQQEGHRHLYCQQTSFCCALQDMCIRTLICKSWGLRFYHATPASNQR
eukprot:475686-Amphidinium_carterae.1